MALDPSIAGDQAPTGGEEPGQQQETTSTPTTPAERTYTQREYDGQFANARRSWESESRRRQDAAIEAVRAEYEQRFAPKPAAQPSDWSRLDPEVRSIFEAEFERRLTPFQQWQQTAQQQQEDLAFRNDEADIRSRYSDYGKNRTAILEFAVRHNIADVEQAYRAWKYDELSSVDPKKIEQDAIARYTKRKTAQASQTPAVEGRGGGAPSSKQQPKDRDEMDEMAKQLFRAAEDSAA